MGDIYNDRFLTTSSCKVKTEVLDNYGMSFGINIDAWLVSLDCLSAIEVRLYEHLPKSNR